MKKYLEFCSLLSNLVKFVEFSNNQSKILPPPPYKKRKQTLFKKCKYSLLIVFFPID